MTKRHILLLISMMCFSIFTATAQDTLHLVNGQSVVVYLRDVGRDAITFCLEPDCGANVTALPKSRVRKIVFQSGKTIIWDKHYDAFDPSINVDSAQAALEGITVEALKARRIREARRDSTTLLEALHFFFSFFE